MKIGEELREHFEVPQETPHKLLTLIMQIDGQHKPQQHSLGQEHP